MRTAEKEMLPHSMHSQMCKTRPCLHLLEPAMRFPPAQRLLPMKPAQSDHLCVITQWRREAPLRFKRVVTPLPQFGNGMLSKEFRIDPFRCRHPSDCFCAIFAKFKRRGVFWIGPCATRAVKAIRLVHLTMRAYLRLHPSDPEQPQQPL